MKFYNNFHKDSTSKYGEAYYCKDCANSSSRKNHFSRMKTDFSYREEKRNSYIKNSHGITAKEYEDKLASQENKCAICQVKLLSRGHGTHLDHCHTTGKLRSFLCTNCNRGLGHFQESVKFLQNAINYLNSHNPDGMDEEGN